MVIFLIFTVTFFIFYYLHQYNHKNKEVLDNPKNKEVLGNKDEVLLCENGFWYESEYGKLPYLCALKRTADIMCAPKYLAHKGLNNITIGDYSFDFYNIENEYKDLFKNINKYNDKKQIILSRENNLISTKLNNIDMKNVFKSKKEYILKKQVKHLKEEFKFLENEFSELKNSNYSETYYRNRVYDNNEVYTFHHIKPNIILENFDINPIQKIFTKYRFIKCMTYMDYIKSRIEEINKEYEGEMYGRLGEEAVIEVTNEFDNCIAIHNVQLPTSNSKQENFITEIDTILVTTRGVFILEVKNYGKVGSYEIKIDSTGQWVTYYPSQNKEVPRENPNKQNNMHVISFNKFINDKLKDKNIDANGVIVIGNDDVKIIQESPTKNLKRVDELYNYIKEFEPKYTFDEVKEIANIINENRVFIDKKYKIKCLYEEVLANLEVIKDDMNKISKLPYNKEDVEQFLRENEEKNKYSIVGALRKDRRSYYVENSRTNAREYNYLDGFVFSADIIDKRKFYDSIKTKSTS